MWFNLDLFATFSYSDIVLSFPDFKQHVHVDLKSQICFCIYYHYNLMNPRFYLFPDMNGEYAPLTVAGNDSSSFDISMTRCEYIPLEN